MIIKVMNTMTEMTLEHMRHTVLKSHSSSGGLVSRCVRGRSSVLVEETVILWNTIITGLSRAAGCAIIYYEQKT